MAKFEPTPKLQRKLSEYKLLKLSDNSTSDEQTGIQCSIAMTIGSTSAQTYKQIEKAKGKLTQVVLEQLQRYWNVPHEGFTGPELSEGVLKQTSAFKFILSESIAVAVANGEPKNDARRRITEAFGAHLYGSKKWREWMKKHHPHDDGGRADEVLKYVLEYGSDSAKADAQVEYNNRYCPRVLTDEEKVTEGAKSLMEALSRVQSSVGDRLLDKVVDVFIGQAGLLLKQIAVQLDENAREAVDAVSAESSAAPTTEAAEVATA